MADTLRQYQVRQGDTIESISHRIFGIAGRWKEIVELNRLDYPYIDTSGAIISEGKNVAVIGSRLVIALLPGDSIADSVFVDVERKRNIDDILFGIDIALTSDGDIAVDNGRADFALVAGGKNLQQAIWMRFMSYLGELSYHPEYGTGLHKLIGEKLNIISAAKAKIESSRTILSDPRVRSIKSLVVYSDGEPRLAVDTVIEAIGESSNVPLNIVLPR